MYTWHILQRKLVSKKLNKILCKIDNENEVSMIAFNYMDKLEANYEAYNAN